MSDTISENKHKALVIILSETRGHKLTFDSFKKNLLDVYNADLCLCVAENEREDLNNPFYSRAKYIFKYPESKDWGDVFDIISNGRNWRRFLKFINWDKVHTESNWLGGVYSEDGRRIPASGAILLFFRWFLKRNLIENNLHAAYTHFIITRSDYMYPCPSIPLTYLDENHIWIPFGGKSGGDAGGYTDKHIVCGKSHVLDILSVADDVVSNSDDFYDKMEHNHNMFTDNMNLERFLKFKFHLLGLNDKIKRYPYTMYAVREVDGHTSWNKGVYFPEFGYCLKREKLYKEVMKSVNTYNKFGWTPESIHFLESIMANGE